MDKEPGESNLLLNIGTAAIAGVVSGVGLAYGNVITVAEGFWYAMGAVMTGVIATGLMWLESNKNKDSFNVHLQP